MPGKHVLVVDDEAAVRELVNGLVRYCGHTVQTADGGTAALALLESTHFDLVITDLHMPGMNGHELAAAIKQRHPELPVILITGDEHQPPRPYIDRVLLKPFSVSQLRAVMSELI